MDYIDKIKSRLKSIAILDAIICPDISLRCYFYNSKWAKGQEIASMRNGSGLEWYLQFYNNNLAWVYINFDEPPIPDVNLIKKEFPASYVSFLDEPAFSINDARIIGYYSDGKWILFGNTKSADGSHAIETFNWLPEDYKNWADTYYDGSFDMNSIRKVFNGEITETIVKNLNVNMTMKKLQEEIEEIGIINTK